MFAFSIRLRMWWASISTAVLFSPPLGTMMSAFRLLAKGRALRGGTWDVFGRTEERRLERELLLDYETSLVNLASKLTSETLPTATKLAELPAAVRGFGHEKLRSIATYKAQRDILKGLLKIS